jgi:glycerol-1-phosphate dehydrogenase [NAD(P)+]
MDSGLSNRMELAKRCTCGHKHFDINIEEIVVDKGGLKNAVAFLKAKSFKNIVVVVDNNTYKAAGKALMRLLEKSEMNVEVCFIEEDEQNDVVANEESIVQLMLSVSKETDILLAVGAGTIHDIARFVSYKMEKPFISIPTAPSVDGFNSMGAPLVIKGVKTTYQTQAPIAVFADLDVLLTAPKKMIAAGFGDMLGKYTSLADWRFSHLVGDEPFCPLAYQITEEALEACVTNLEKIAAGNEEGFKVLTESLILSGIAMLLIGHSYPASGAEHHLSHYWEMEFLRKRKAQVLHGAKVSISCYLIADLYKTIVKKAIAEIETLPLSLENKQIEKVIENKQAVLDIMDKIPDSTELKKMVSIVGGETEPKQLGIDDELIQKSYKEAHFIRERFTLLYFYNHYIREATE